jgi:hypothetical protein
VVTSQIGIIWRLKSQKAQVPTAPVTGVTDQDGSYLAEHLLDAGYEVQGPSRPPPTTIETRGSVTW